MVIILKCFIEICFIVIVSKILVSAKTEFTASNPLSSGAFAFIYPLLSVLIQRGGRAAMFKEKILTELVMYSSDILFAHCGLGGSVHVPRTQMIKDLIELITRYPRLHGAAREGILTLCISLEDAAADLDAEDYDEDVSLKDRMKTDENAITLELLEATLNREPVAREACMKALQHLPTPEGYKGGIAASRIWVMKYDTNENISAEADRVWEMWNDNASISSDSLFDIVTLICKYL